MVKPNYARIIHHIHADCEILDYAAHISAILNVVPRSERTTMEVRGGFTSEECAFFDAPLERAFFGGRRL